LILLLAAEKSADGEFVHFRTLLLAASFEFPKPLLFRPEMEELFARGTLAAIALA